MAQSFDFRGLFRKYPELTYGLLAIAFYMVSTIFGVKEIGGTVTFYGIDIHVISTPLWAIFGLLSLYFLYTAFFDMWIYAVNLIIAYFLVGAGVLAIYLFSDNIYITFIGAILLFGAIVFTMLFIIRIGTIRRHHVLTSTDPKTAKEKYSLGYWYLFPFFFLGITVISFLDIAYAYDHSSHFPYIHLIAEGALSVVVIYILWVPENVLFFGYTETQEAERRAATEDVQRASARTDETKGESGVRVSRVKGEIKQIIPPLSLRHRGEAENCPGLDVAPVQKKKMCPFCHNVMTLDWCPQSEEFLIKCPSCGKKTYYGRKVCVHCKARLPEEITCESCGRSFPVRKMKDAE